MTSLRERINSHLPILLQLLSTISLVVLALSAVCGTKYLKKLANSHQAPIEIPLYEDHSGHNH